MRLNRFLARAGLGARRAVEELVLEGRVIVNGRRAADLALTVVPGKDTVKVDGRRVRLPESHDYFAFYKPRGVVSTLSDPEGRPCLRSYLPGGAKGLFAVGRLDYQSEGLILLTNDGELGERMLHPRHKVVKTYTIKVKGDPPAAGLDRLRRGITLEGRRTLPMAIRRLPASEKTRHTWLKIEMVEGRKNQLREMFFRIRCPVIKLKRVAMGPVRLGSMKAGSLRPLTAEEVSFLRSLAGLEPGAALPEPAFLKPPPRKRGRGRPGASAPRADDEKKRPPRAKQKAPRPPGRGAGRKSRTSPSATRRNKR